MPSCPTDEVHVWSIGLDRPDASVRRLAELLAPDERARAERFVFPRDRRRFTVARAALRTILGVYLAREPAGLVFGYGPRGKPRIDAEIEFNLAHSHELALCAVARRPVGIDLEHRRPIAEVARLAETAFSPPERAVLLALPESARADAFFACWTRKEAYVKARGDGLYLPLDGFDVSLGEPAALLANRLDPAEPARWALYSLAPAADYVGALAVARPAVRLGARVWSPTSPSPVAATDS